MTTNNNESKLSVFSRIIYGKVISDDVVSFGTIILFSKVIDGKWKLQDNRGFVVFECDDNISLSDFEKLVTDKKTELMWLYA